MNEQFHLLSWLMLLLHQQVGIHKSSLKRQHPEMRELPGCWHEDVVMLWLTVHQAVVVAAVYGPQSAKVEKGGNSSVPSASNRQSQFNWHYIWKELNRSCLGHPKVSDLWRAWGLSVFHRKSFEITEVHREFWLAAKGKWAARLVPVF